MKKPGSAFHSPEASLDALSKPELIARLESLPCAPKFTLDACPAQRFRLELGIHRIELETQNEELLDSEQRMEEARDRYSDLYDFAPVGYLTLDKAGSVREINLTGASMLGGERGNVLGKSLPLWLHPTSHNAFHQHLKHVFESSDRVVDEMLLRGDDVPPRYISMVSNAVTHGPAAGEACRTALVDITPLKEKEQELTRSSQQLRNLSAHLDQVREDERRRMAREIHDELGQKLTTLRFEVAMLGSAPNGTPAGLSHAAASLLKQIDDTIESVRAIASDLRPAVLDLGIIAALEWQVKEFRRRTGIDCGLKVGNEDIALDNERATAVFRIVQESLTNVARHAGASRVRVILGRTGDRLNIEVVDNGIGLPSDALMKARSFGIAGMRERVLLLGGEMEINSRPTQGTHLKVSIPLREKVEP